MKNHKHLEKRLQRKEWRTTGKQERERLYGSLF